MKTSVEELEDNKVKLSVQVEEHEFEKAVDAAFRKIAREVNIPGFRPGKAPRRILEKRLGEGVARGEALRDAIPEYYAQAVRDNDVDVIAAPEIDITEGEEDGPIAFEAVVEVRPVVLVPGYESLRITMPAPVATEEEIDDQIQRMLGQHAELATVERPAAEGDYVTIDIEGSQGDEALEGLTAQDYSYEVGSGGIVGELDEALVGASAGDQLEFDAEHPDPDEDGLHFVVSLKEVKERVLPEPDDAWAAEASEFDTIAELRDDLANRMTAVRKMQAQMSLREKVSDALAELVDLEVSDALVNNEMQQRLQDFAMRLQAQGLTLDQWLENSGQDQAEFVETLRTTAAQAAKFDLGLRAVAAAEGIEATDDDLDAEFAQVAERLNLEPAAVRKQFVDADQIPQVEADIRLRKALDFLVSTVEIVDEEGNPIDRADFEIADDDTSNDTDDASLVEAQADDAASVKDSNDDAGDADTDSEHEEGNE
ncbi:MAG: trigger factor [Acidimicrobiales bacterium]